MRKNILSILLCFAVVALYSQKKQEIISSKKLGEDRELVITLPQSYDSDSKRKYPLMLLLDGDYLFDPFFGAMEYSNYWDDMPELILVGINQNKGEQRYTDCEVDETTGLPNDTGENFFEFIGMEVMPYLEKNFRIAPFKVIAGHDVTAAFINFFLYKETPLFDAYISLSPELATDMETHIPQRLAQIKKPIYYYHATADGDLKKMRTRINTLHEGISAVQNINLNYKFDDFIGASHYSLVLYAIPSALYQFFSVYQPISVKEFQEKIVKMDGGYVDYLTEKYNTIENALSIKMPIRLNDFKAIEAAIIKNQHYNEFDALSILARKHYPKSMLADYHMAMMYEKKGDYKRAQKSYLRAFQMEPIGELDKDMMYDKSEEMKRME
ncbi:MAG TPA: alpha/beta hydrolase-fold protein [Flavobacterium sp.]|nr:alpha/beta hydrolase-fold protein [Flavobacterium sp.]